LGQGEDGGHRQGRKQANEGDQIPVIQNSVSHGIRTPRERGT
jgi:hypothetical protein